MAASAFLILESDHARFLSVLEKIGRESNSQTCPRGVHHRVSSFSIVSVGSSPPLSKPTARLNQPYIASRFSREYPWDVGPTKSATLFLAASRP